MEFARVAYARIGYLRRHYRTLQPYLTPRKIANALLNEAEMRRQVMHPRSLPIYLKLEPTPLCQLRCPGCRHNDELYNSGQNRNMMLSLAGAQTIVGPLKHALLGVSLSHLGEPFMNENLLAIVRYLHQERISVSFPTNFSFAFSDEKIEQIVDSGVDQLLISLDGASPETYERYRQGGNFDQVLDNVARVSATKKKLRVAHPLLTWKFVVFDHNRHEVPAVKATFAELGFDRYELVQDNTSQDANKVRRRYNDDLKIRRKPCYWLWNTMVIRWDGTVHPCCSTLALNLGNCCEEDSAVIWRSEAYADVRRGFRRKTFGEGMVPRCRSCIGLGVAGVTGT